MRLVTILILFTLAAGAYVANFAAKERQPNVGTTTELASGAGDQGAVGLQGPSTAGVDGAGPLDGMASGPVSGTLEGDGTYPSEFPSELTMRSGGARGDVAAKTELPGSPLDSPLGSTTVAASQAPKTGSTPTRRRVPPKVRQPSAEENAERDRLVAERFGPKTPRPTVPDTSTAETPEVKIITLPARKPARERVVEQLKVEGDSGQLEVKAGSLAGSLEGAVAKTDGTPAENSIKPSSDLPLSEISPSDVPSGDVASAPAKTVMSVEESAPAPIETKRPIAANAPKATDDDAAPSATTPSLPKLESSTAQPASAAIPEVAQKDITPVAAPVGGTLRARVIDSTGHPVPKVRVTVVNVATNRAVTQLQMDETGSAVAEALKPGNYRLQVDTKSVPLSVSSPIGIDQCRVSTLPAGYGSECLQLASNDETVAAEIVLPLSSGVQGTILGKTGAPVKGVLVRAISRVPGFEEQRTVAETNEKGFFFFGLVPGPYELQMLLPGSGRPEELTRSMDVTLKPGSALLLDAVDFSKKAPERQSNAAAPVAAPAPAAPAAVQPKVRPAAKLAANRASTTPTAPAPLSTEEPAPKPQVIQPAAVRTRSASAKVKLAEPTEIVLPKEPVVLSAAVPIEPTLSVESTTVFTQKEGKPGRVELRGRVIS